MPPFDQDGLPSPFPRVLDKHGPFLGKYPSVPGFFDDFDGLFVLSPTELVATIDELENLLATYLNPLVCEYFYWTPSLTDNAEMIRY